MSGCAITVHENSCRDQVNDCTRFKVPKSVPLGSKVSLANLISVAKHACSTASSSSLPSATAQAFTMSSFATQSATTSSSTTTTPTSSTQTPSTPVASPLFANR